MIHLEETFDGHIILYCKGHYIVEGVDFITGLQRIWATRCGIEFSNINNSVNEYMADKLHEILVKCNPNKLPHMHQILNRGLVNDWQYNGLNAIQRVIMIYANELTQLQIKKSKGNLLGKPISGYTTLIKLNKPQKRLFKQIVKGNSKYNNYKLVK